MCDSTTNDRSSCESDPETIVSDARLSLDEKLRLLGEQILDLEAELRASEENMTSPEPGQAADRLQRAKRLHLALAAEHGQG